MKSWVKWIPLDSQRVSLGIQLVAIGSVKQLHSHPKSGSVDSDKVDTGEMMAIPRYD